jgi:hypothetical protein
MIHDNQKNGNKPNAHHPVGKMWCFQTKDYYLGIKNSEVRILAMRQMNLENTPLRGEEASLKRPCPVGFR